MLINGSFIDPAKLSLKPHDRIVIYNKTVQEQRIGNPGRFIGHWIPRKGNIVVRTSSNLTPCPSLTLQASNQTDLENWVTAIHSASASLLAKRQGKEDTVRLLRSQVRGLLQKIDMDGKMKKMAELQLTVVSDPKNRKAIENQVRQ